MKNEINDDELIARHFSGAMSEEEFNTFNERIGSDEKFRDKIETYRQLWEDTADLRLMQGLSMESRWKKLDASLDNKTGSEYIRFWRYAAALVLLVAAVSVLFLVKLNPEQKKVITQKGEIKKVTLPDQSVITLNASSELTYIPSRFHKQRRVELKGEGFFQIQKQKAPFLIQAAQAQVEVLGTTFNVSTFDEKVKVDCATGRVKISIDEKRNLVLTRGKGVQVIRDQLGDIYEIDVEQIASWREGRLYFHETPVPDVVAEMERYFDVDITVGRGVSDLTFTGRFDHPDLETMLKTLCLSAGLDYEMTDENHVKIK